MKRILTFMLFTMMMVPLIGAARRHHRAKTHQSFSSQYYHVKTGKRLANPICWHDVQSVVPAAKGVWSDLAFTWAWITDKVQEIISTVTGWMKSSAFLVAREFAPAPPSPSEKRINTWRPGFLQAQKKHAKRMKERNVPELKPMEEPAREEPVKTKEIEKAKEPIEIPLGFKDALPEPDTRQGITDQCTQPEQRVAKPNEESLAFDSESSTMLDYHQGFADEHHDMFDVNQSTNQSACLPSMHQYSSNYELQPMYQQPVWYQQHQPWTVQQQPMQFSMAAPSQSSQQLSSIAMQLQSSAMAMQAQAATLMMQAQQQQYMPWQQVQPLQVPPITTRDATRQEKMAAARQAIQLVVGQGNASVQRLLLILDHEFDLLEHLVAGNTGQRVDSALRERNKLLEQSNASVVTAYDRLVELATTHGHDDEIGVRMYHYCARKSKQNKSSFMVSRSKKQFLLHMICVLERYYEIIEKMLRAFSVSYSTTPEYPRLLSRE